MHAPKKDLVSLWLNVFVFAVEARACVGMNHHNIDRQTEAQSEGGKIIRDTHSPKISKKRYTTLSFSVVQLGA